MTILQGEHAARCDGGSAEEMRPVGFGALIVCYGNPLRGDDGLGWHVSALLAEDPRLTGADVIWRHQLTPDIAADIKDVSLVILVDVNVADEPGAVSVRRLDSAKGSGAGAGGSGAAGPSSHHVDPTELMALARELWGATPAVYVVSAGAATLDVGDALSPAVEAALPTVVDAAAGIVAEHSLRGAWGVRNLDSRLA